MAAAPNTAIAGALHFPAPIAGAGCGSRKIAARHSLEIARPVSATAAGTLRYSVYRDSSVHRQPRSDRIVGPRARKNAWCGNNRHQEGADGRGSKMILMARACPGHPRLTSRQTRKTWMAGSSRPYVFGFVRLQPTLRKPQIRRLPSLALGLGAVACHRVVGPGQFPVGRALRGQPNRASARDARASRRNNRRCR